MPNEVICTHIGQAGCHMGLDLWELVCSEHGIKPER